MGWQYNIAKNVDGYYRVVEDFGKYGYTQDNLRLGDEESPEDVIQSVELILSDLKGYKGFINIRHDEERKLPMFGNIFESLPRWRIERNLTGVAQTPENILKKMREELLEAEEALEAGDIEGFIDGICDSTVFGYNGIEQLGYNAEHCMSECLREIHSCKGTWVEEQKKFVKQFTGNEYKACYSKCKRREQ